jgi:CDP-6-deoxy-D-xylo-4-hexulose-3-dehydrase
MIKLAEATIDNNDIDELVEWLKTYPRLTKGNLTPEFEAKWSSYLGVKHSTFVNSGSSANLLMLATLMEAGKLEPGDGVIVPALSWATDVAPIMQLGLRPMLCDCDLDDYSVDPKHFRDLLENGELEENAIRRSSLRHRAKAAIIVPVLGYVPEMESIKNLCDKFDVILLEDCCEALGSEYEGHKLGTFGEMSTFSTYFGHHISTIEGGMVCTSNPEYDAILKSIRSHGWSRDWSSSTQKKINKKWGVSEFDSLYTFYHAGFNVRSTDLQAFLGIRQLDKLEEINKTRHENFLLYSDLLEVSPQPDYCFISNFAFPIVSKNRDKIVKVLQENDVEVRPMICGSMGKQPFYVKKYGKKYLPNADLLREQGMYLPNHHLLTRKDIEFVCGLIKDLV